MGDVRWRTVYDINTKAPTEAELVHAMAAHPVIQNAHCFNAWRIRINVDGSFYLQVGYGRKIREPYVKPVFPKRRKR